MTTHRYPIGTFPSGWFLVGLSKEFLSGQVKTKKIFNKEVVVFRTQAGIVSVLDAYCPHLGAHLGHGGKVKGESIRCPFHGFCFNTEGNCTSNCSTSNTPKNLAIKKWKSSEKRGFVFTWYDDENKEPTWEVPDFNTDGWSPYKTISWDLPVHPLDICENPVDINHFNNVHICDEIKVLQEPSGKNHIFHVKYSLSQLRGFGLSKKPILAELDIDLYGLGYTIVNVSIPEFHMKAQIMGFHTPIDHENLKLTSVLCITQLEIQKKIILLKLIPKKLINLIMLKSMFYTFLKDIRSDIEIWKYKKYILEPALVPGESSIGKYRKWAKQFYKNGL